MSLNIPPMNKSRFHAILLISVILFFHKSSFAQGFEDNPISVAVDNTNFQFGSGSFFPDLTASTKGGSSVKSRFFEGFAFPTLTVFTTGDVTITFDYKFKRQVFGDKLVFQGFSEFGPLVEKDIASVTFSGWRTASIYLPQGAESVNWFVKKTNALTSASIDNVRIVPGDQTSGTAPSLSQSNCNSENPFFDDQIAESVDNTLFRFFSDGQFFRQKRVSFFGRDSAQATETQLGDTVSFGTGFTSSAPVAVEFTWKVSSQAGGDFLVYEIFDQNLVSTGIGNAISGEVDWKRESFLVPRGTHFLVWYYVNASEKEAGQNTGWVDKLIINGVFDEICITNISPIISLLLSDAEIPN